MSEQNPFERTPIVYDLPEPLLGFPKVAIEQIDTPTRTIHFRFVGVDGVARPELNTAKFEGTFETAAILADIAQSINPEPEEAE